MEAAKGYPRVIPSAKSGDEMFHQGARPLDLKLLDFWRWSASDLVSNATRGILAEHIVARALGLTLDVRAEWDAFDLLLPPTEAEPQGIKVEVKSASYFQTWFHQKLSPISFGIAPTQLWDANTNTISGETKRQAHIYVFCLLGRADMRKADLNPLDLEQWTFYVLATSVLDARAPTQKTIGLASLEKLNPHLKVYGELGACVRELTL